MSDLTSLPNIGKVIAGKLQKLGIKTAEDFLARDPYQVFDELLENADPTLCRCVLASIVGAHRGKKWNLEMKKVVAEFEKMHPNHRWGKC